MHIFKSNRLSLCQTIFFLLISPISVKAICCEHGISSAFAQECKALYDQIYGQNDLVCGNPSWEVSQQQLSGNLDSEGVCGLTESEILENQILTFYPKWASKDMSVNRYYLLHAETQLDRNLAYLSTNLTGVVIHGTTPPEKLESDLNCYDIDRLLRKGPYKNNLLSYDAQKLIFASLKSVNQVIDIHMHNFGFDEGNYTNPNISTFELAPWSDYFKFMVLRYASGISSSIGSTQEARERLQLYAHHFPKLQGMILPIHKAIAEDGTPLWELTGQFFKNRSARLTAKSFCSRNCALYPAVSIHPYDLKWREKMIKAYNKGILLIKWMPPQGIDPSSPKMDEFYKQMNQLGMTLIAHSGPEHAISTTEDTEVWRDYGNPLRFRRPLWLGVNVILAHSGHFEPIPDLDDSENKLVCGHDLFMRLAKEAHFHNQNGTWKGKLYGDLAAVTTHYGPEFAKQLLIHSNEEGIRLIYGSDYPFTNLVKPFNDPYETCAEMGLLKSEKISALKEIRDWNPLLANYVFVRNLEWKDEKGKTLRFPISCFNGNFKKNSLKFIDFHRYKNL